VLIRDERGNRTRLCGLAQAWTGMGSETVMQPIDALPADRAIWVSARATSSRRWWRTRSRLWCIADATGLAHDNTTYESRGAVWSLVCVIRATGTAVIYVPASSEAAADALARKLAPLRASIPGCLCRDEATNEATGEWRSATTPLAAT